MKYAKKIFTNENEKLSEVAVGERNFERSLDDCVRRVCESGNAKIIRLSGPSCSGKTTVAGKLVRDFSAAGKTVHVVSIDDFFLDKARQPDVNGKVDFDSVKAIDLPEFERCVDSIFGGGVAKMPVFDFTTGARSGYYEIDPDEDNDLFIFEGIQAVYPEITSILSRRDGIGIYISPRSSLTVDGIVFEPNEIRLMRRIVRDFNFRGASPEYSMTLWQSVRENEEMNIFPYADSCEIQIDSTMCYELNVLVQYLRPLLAEIGVESENYRTAMSLMKKTEGIEPIPQKMIPEGSMYYEFIKNENKN